MQNGTTSGRKCGRIFFLSVTCGHERLQFLTEIEAMRRIGIDRHPVFHLVELAELLVLHFVLCYPAAIRATMDSARPASVETVNHRWRGNSGVGR